MCVCYACVYAFYIIYIHIKPICHMSDANWSTKIECVAVTCDSCSCCSRKTSSLDIISLRKSQNWFWKFESRPHSGHYITLHHIIITLSGITASLWALDPTRASDFRWHHPCDVVQRIPTVRYGMGQDSHLMQLDMVQRCPTEFLNCQMFKRKSVLRPRPSTAVSCSVHMATVTNSDHLHWGS